MSLLDRVIWSVIIILSCLGHVSLSFRQSIQCHFRSKILLEIVLTEVKIHHVLN